jgi:hypothetical protein
MGAIDGGALVRVVTAWISARQEFLTRGGGNALYDASVDADKSKGQAARDRRPANLAQPVVHAVDRWIRLVSGEGK